MSSADFANFGATALNLAGTAYIVGETSKMLRNAERQARPRSERKLVRKVRKEAKKAGRRVSEHKSILGERFDLGMSF